MNAEKILNNESTYYNLTQEFNLSDTLTNLIREELEINSNSSELFNVNFYNNLNTLENVGNLPSHIVDNKKITCAEFKPIDFDVSSCFKSSPIKKSENVKGKPNPRKLGYSKKRRSINLNKHIFSKNETLKQGTDGVHHAIVESNADNPSQKIEYVSKLISDVTNRNIVSKTMILENDNQGIVGDRLYNLKDSIDLIKSRNNLEKKIDVDEDCNSMQNGNVLSTPMIHENHDDESILNTSNYSENIEDIQKYIEQTQDKNKISMPVQEKILEAAVEDYQNSDQEFIIEEEFFIDDQPISDVKNENTVPAPITLEDNHKPMDQHPVDGLGSLDGKIVIAEELTTDNNNKSVCNLKEKNVVPMPMTLKENHKAAIDIADTSYQETVIEKEFTVDNKPICELKKNNVAPIPMTVEENNETAGDNADNSDQATVIEKELIIDNKSMSNLKEENLVTVPMVLEDNCKITVDKTVPMPLAQEKSLEKIAVKGFDNLDKETVIKEKFTIDNKSIGDLKKENVVPAPITSEKNCETLGGNIVNSNQETVIDEELVIDNNKHLSDLKDEKVVPLPMVLEKNCETAVDSTIATPIAEKNNLEETTVGDFDNSDQEFIIEEEYVIDDNPICDVKNENTVPAPITLEDNHGPVDVDSPGSLDRKIVIAEGLTADNNKSVCNLKEENTVPMPMTLNENHKAAIDIADTSHQKTVIEKEFTVDNKDICELKKNNMAPIPMAVEENNETADDNADNSNQETDIEEELIIDNKPISNLKEETVIDGKLFIDNNKAMSDLKDEKAVSLPMVLEKNCETGVDSGIATPIAQENNLEETTVDGFDNSDQEFIIEEEYVIDDNPICDVQHENKVSPSMTPEENHKMTADNNIGNSDQELIIEEEFFIDDDIQNENIDNTYNSKQEIDDLQNEDILPTLLNFVENNSISTLDNSDCLDTEKDLNKFIDEVSSENIFAIPITPEKSSHGSSDKNDPLFITPIKKLNKNLIDNLTPSSLEGVNSDDEYDKLCNEKFFNSSHNIKLRSIRSDSEYERLCETIPNNSMEEAKFNYETIDLLNFNNVDLSTNDKIADLLGSPEINYSSRKNQDYMITVDPLIDHSTLSSFSDISDDSDLGIEVKSRHIKKIIKRNTERKKFFKMQKKSLSAQSSNSVVENGDEFTKETRYRTRRKRLRSNGSVNYNEDTDDSLDGCLQTKAKKSRVKCKRTKKAYSNIEDRRSSRILKESINKENSQDDCVNIVNGVNIGKKLPIIRLRRITSLKPQNSNNQENERISTRNPEDDIWTLNFDNSFHENNQNSFEDDKTLESNGMKADVNESIAKKFFSDDENQRSYDQLTDLSLINTNDHLSEKLITNDVVDTRRESLDGKSNDNDETTTNLNNNLVERNLELEKEEVLSPILQVPSEKGPTEEIEKQPCNEVQESMEVDQPAEEMTECRLQDTSFVGRKIKMSEKMKDFLNDTHQSNIDENVVSSSTEKCWAEKSPSKLKKHNNSKSQNLPTSSNDNKLIESDSEVSDVTDNHESDSSDSSFSVNRMNRKSLNAKLNKSDDTEKNKKKLMKKILYLKVKLEHEVPKQHKIEKNLGEVFHSKKIKAEFYKYAIIQSGRFTLEENQILRRNWERFCEVHELDPSCVTLLLENCNPIKSLFAYMKDRNKLIQFLARDLPNRLLIQVYHRFRSLYLIPERKKKLIEPKRYLNKFKAREDRIIMMHMNDEDEPDVKKNLKELSKLLKRPESIILERYNTLKEGQNICTTREKKCIEWDVLKAETFIKELMELTLTEDIYELRYARIPSCIWDEMEKRLKLPKIKLKHFWFTQLHLQLFSSNPIFASDLKTMLIEYLIVKGISSRDQIEWSVVAEHFNHSVTSEYLSRTFSILLCKAPFKDKEKNLAGCIEWMYQERIRDFVEARYDYQLPRLAYKDGKLEFIDGYSNESESELSSD